MSKIKIMPSKTLAKTLAKNLKNNYCIENVIQVVMTPDEYKFRVDVWGPDMDELEFDNEGRWIIKCLKIVYKPEMYAMSRYVNLRELRELARGVSDIDGFVKNFENKYNI